MTPMPPCAMQIEQQYAANLIRGAEKITKKPYKAPKLRAVNRNRMTAGDHFGLIPSHTAITGWCIRPQIP